MIEEEQHDIHIPEKEISIAEPPLVSPSIDTFFVNPVRYADYSFKLMIDMYSNFRDSLLLSRICVSFLI